MKTTLIVLLLSILFLSGMNLSALTLDEVLEGLPEQAIQELEAVGEVYRTDRDNRGIKLLPDVSMAGEIRSRITSLGPDVFSEALYLIPYNEEHSGIDVSTYNITRQVSAISEVKYQSSRKKAVVPLFDDVYAISDMRKKERIEDPLVDRIPVRDTIYTHMKEVNLGSAVYQTDYLWDGENLGFFMKNLSNLRFLIKVVGKENMQINLLLIPTDQGFLVYGACAVLLSNADIVYDMMDPYTSFFRRMHAIVVWIYSTMHESNRSPDFGNPLNF